MSLPRMSLDALVAKLSTESQSLCSIVEGFSDRKILSRYISQNDINAVVYSSDEIDIRLLDQFSPYGGNKGRVLSLFVSPDTVKYQDVNLIAFIDRDIDFVLERVIKAKGIYYSKGACLLSRNVSRSNISVWFEDAFGKKVSSVFIDEVLMFSWKCFYFFAEKQKRDLTKQLPSISKCVRKLKTGGFDWSRFCRTTHQTTGLKIDVDETAPPFNEEKICECVNIHVLLDYLWELGRKEGLIDNSVSRSEMDRHLYVRAINTSADCESARTIQEKASQLL